MTDTKGRTCDPMAALEGGGGSSESGLQQNLRQGTLGCGWCCGRGSKTGPGTSAMPPELPRGSWGWERELGVLTGMVMRSSPDRAVRGELVIMCLCVDVSSKFSNVITAASRKR